MIEVHIRIASMSKENCGNKDSFEYDEIIRSFRVAGKSFARAIEPVANAISQVLPIIAQMQPYIEALASANKIIDSVLATGWLPHHTIGIDYIKESMVGTSSLESRIREYYEKNWLDIRHDIESRMACYRVSEEAKETFREAMDAHEAGHYRCVCRVLFPELDRELRIRFFNDSTGRIDSREMLKALANRGSLEEYLQRSVFSYILFTQLATQLYKNVKESNKSQFELRDVPNRHAALHGLVRYTTHKHSMNMLVMTDYIFEILTMTSHLPLQEN